MPRIFLALGAIGLFCASPGVTQAQSPCEPPAYASQLAEASIAARADIRLQAIKQLSDQTLSQLGPNPRGTVSVDGRYAVWAASELAQGAYSDTLVAYFCALERHYANNPARLAIVTREQRRLRAAFLQYFDAELWAPGQPARLARAALLDELGEGESTPPLIPRAELEAVLPRYSFDVTRLRQVTADVSVNEFASLGVCGGWVTRSIRRVDPSVLSGLRTVRATILDWLSGEQVDARLDLYTFITQQMNPQTAGANASESVAVTPEFMTCLDNAERQAARDSLRAPQGAGAGGENTSTPSATTPPNGTTVAPTPATTPAQRPTV